MNKDLVKFLIAFFVMIAAIAGILFVSGRYIEMRIALSHAQKSLPSNGAAKIIPLANGDQSVRSASGSYAFTISKNWYAEPDGDAGVAVYPDYSPNASSPPQCKIEISVFPNVATDSLSDFMNGRLRSDPTVAVTENSVESVSIGGATGIRWVGTINGRQSELAYAIANGKGYELAPSSLSNGDSDSCATYLDELTNLFRFTL